LEVPLGEPGDEKVDRERDGWQGKFDESFELFSFWEIPDSFRQFLVGI
jgi:hypothetical protein